MNHNHITVGLIGIPTIEAKRLHAAFLHSQSRQTSYTSAHLNNLPQILMVNADKPTSLIEWRRYRNQLEEIGKSDPPSVLVSKYREFKTQHYQIRCPLIVSRAISILDQITVNEFSLNEEQAFIPDLANATRYSQTEIDESRLKKNTLQNNKLNNETLALVVDDSLPVRIQMLQALKPFTSRIDFAETGEKAFELININDYHIIFLDVILPSIDGYEICKVIKQSRAKNTPIIMLTGNSSPADKIKGKLAGCDTYLIKPVKQSILREIFIQYLNKPLIKTCQY